MPVLALCCTVALAACEDATVVNGGGNIITVSVLDFQFSPPTATVETGQTVTWEFLGDVLHTVTWTAGTPAGSGQMGSGTYSRTFATAGSYGYFCEIHPNQMQGTITVE